MYCEKCNKKFPENSKYCDVCGKKLKKLEEDKVTITEKNNTPKDKWGKKIVIIIIVLFAFAVFSTVFFVSSFVKWNMKVSTLEYIKLGNDSIPTMYKNNNIKAKINSKEISNDEIEIDLYYNNLYDNNIINDYIAFLGKENFVFVREDVDDFYLVKESVDSGKILLVELDKDFDDSEQLTITYEKRQGNISNYLKKVNYKRVGLEKFGYIDIDSTWKLYSNNNEMIEYRGETGYLILNYIENSSFDADSYADNIYNCLLEDDVEDLEISNIMVDNYNSYQISAFDANDNTYICIWIFQDDDGIIHYIKLNSYGYTSDVFSSIESYSLER